MKTTKILVGFVCLLLTYFFVQPVGVNFAQEKYPTKPIKFIVVTAAGGIIDVSSRKIVSIAEKYLGQEIIVENKPGAGTLVPTTLLAKSKPDGYIIGNVTTSPFNVHPFFSKMEYDPLTAFTPIIQFVNFDQTLGVPMDSPFKTFDDFMQEARKRQVIVGGQGMTPAEMALKLLVARGKINVRVIPFGGSAPILLAAAGGQVEAFVCSGVHEFVRAGKVRIIARLNGKPKKGEVPTLRELGYDIEAVSFGGIAGPKGLPEDVQKTLEEAFTRAALDPSVGELIRNIGDSLDFANSKDFYNNLKEAHERAQRELKELKLGIFSGDKK